MHLHLPEGEDRHHPYRRAKKSRRDKVMTPGNWIGLASAGLMAVYVGHTVIQGSVKHTASGSLLWVCPGPTQQERHVPVAPDRPSLIEANGK